MKIKKNRPNFQSYDVKCCINIPLLFVFKLQKKLLFIGFPCIFAFRRLGAQSTSDNIFFLRKCIIPNYTSMKLFPGSNTLLFFIYEWKFSRKTRK